MSNVNIKKYTPVLRPSHRRFYNSIRLLATRLGGAAYIAVASTSHAYAQGGGVNPATILTDIATFILGPFGQSLAILGIVAIGVSWMFGRASLGLIAGVIGGIIIMFGSSYIAKSVLNLGGG